MLVLTRRKDEAIILGDDIIITILDINSERVKIGLSAPKSTRILRAELKVEVCNVNREATQTNLQFLKQLSETNDKKTAEQSADHQKPPESDENSEGKR